MRKILILFIFPALLIFPVFAFAQFNSFSVTDISTSISPQTPGPLDNVTIRAESFGTDLNKATIRWSLNDRVIKEGIGLKTFSFQMGQAGTVSKIDLFITTDEGEAINRSFSFAPNDVDLVWQTNSYTPPWFNGKPLFSHQNIIKFIAIPHIIQDGKEVPSSNLIYTWTRNDTVLGDFSGYGKNTYTMQGSIISRPLDMIVKVSTLDGNDIGFAETVVAPVDPIILFYEKSPLYGLLYQRFIGQDYYMTSPEVEISAVPIFFGVSNPTDSNLAYHWNINGSQLNNASPSQIFRAPENQKGYSNIYLSIENSAKELQSASSKFNLNFDTEK